MIQLKPLMHRDMLFIAIIGKLNGSAYSFVVKHPDRKYSATHRCYYLPYSPEQLKNLVTSLCTLAEVNTSEWDDETYHPRNSELIKPWITLPEEYRETLTKLRYSDATLQNYVAQFGLFLGFIYPKQADAICDEDIHQYLLYLSSHRKVSISTQNQAINSISFTWNMSST